MSQAKLVRVGALVAGAIYALLPRLSDILGIGLTHWLARFIPLGVGVGAVAFDLWVWRWPWVLRWTGRPYLRGTWRTSISPSAHDATTGGSIDAWVVIEQTFWTLHLRLLTAESASRSTATALNRAPGSSETTLTYTYLAEPRQQVRADSPIHWGAGMLTAVGRRPETIDGSYWTDRKTTGDLHLHREPGTPHIESFAEAERKSQHARKAP